MKKVFSQNNPCKSAVNIIKLMNKQADADVNKKLGYFLNQFFVNLNISR
jgi:hypothetical protein